MIVVSGLFDEAYYRASYPDVCASRLTPLAHFVLRGAYEGRNPHPLFDGAYYLRRNPDIAGFLFWQSQINQAPVRDVPKQNALVCSFITAAEYQFRFGPNAPRTNSECPQ